MQFKSVAFIAAAILSSALPGVFGAEAVKEGDVFTATRVLHTVIKESPFMVDRTTTVVWTAGPVLTTSESASPIPETIAKPPSARRSAAL